jgi:hypothetical protein
MLILPKVAALLKLAEKWSSGLGHSDFAEGKTYPAAQPVDLRRRSLSRVDSGNSRRPSRRSFKGAAVGAMIRGIPVVNGQYSGSSWEWFEALPVLCCAIHPIHAPQPRPVPAGPELRASQATARVRQTPPQPPQPCSGAFSWGSLHPVAVWHLSLISRRNADYESRSPTVGEPSPGPVHINQDPVAKSRQQKEVH